MNGSAAGYILVAGVGNIFLGDDAFGVEVATRMSCRALPPNVRVVDFGIRGYDLAYALMESWEMVVLVDVVSCGGEPGTLYVIEPELPTGDDAPEAFDAHSMDPVSVLQLVKTLGGRAAPVLVVGCEPSPVSLANNTTLESMSLSSPVEAAVEEAIRVIDELISSNRKSTAA